MFSSEAWLANPGANFYNGVATQSLRFDDGSNAYLSRTPSSAGNRKTWTWSCWLKLGDFTTTRRLFMATQGANINSTGDMSFVFPTSGKLLFQQNATSGVTFTTTAVYRDPSAWYNFVLVFDSTDGTANDRCKIYVNGVRQEGTNNGTITSNLDGYVNTTNFHTIGMWQATNQPYDGYLSEVNFIDGSALDPTSFGETKNGVWIPKKYETKPSLIAQGTGTAIGDMTSGGGLAGAFNGTQFQSYASSAQQTSSQATSFIGKNWGSSKTVTGFILYSNTQFGFLGSGASTFTVKLYGKNGNPSNSTDGTLLFTSSAVTDANSRGSIRYFADTNIQSEETISSFNTTTAFTYHWVVITPNTSEGAYVSEIEFYEDGSTYYGTNGFRLQFNQTGVGTASTSTIGADTSGNTNHFTSSGIVASDCSMPDSPENNFCTLNGVAKSSGLTLSNGNLQTNTANKFALGTIGVNSGKWYFENYVNSTNGGFVAVYEADTGVYSTTIDDGGNNPDAYGYYSNGQKVRNGSFVNYGSAFTTAGDIIGVALDMDNGAIYFSKNGTWQNSATTSEISAGTTTNSAYTGLSGNMVARVGHYNNNNPTIVNFGQDASFAGSLTGSNIGDETPDEGAGVFKYAPPSGFLALCSANLPEPTISPNSSNGTADDYFNTVLYNGNGGTQNITGFGFQPDWIWDKSRNQSGSHMLVDSSRGVGKYLRTNVTSAEVDDASILTHFISDGVTVGDINGNASSSSAVMWGWKANGGTTSSNTDGSITSTVQANTDAGFSIVQFVGDANGSSTVGHGLSKTPNMVIVKPTSRVDGWAVYHSSLGADKLVELHSANGEQSSSGYWGSVTSSVFGLSAGGTNNRSGATHIAYCFAEIEGYSKFGSYTGNGSSDGTFVYLGFRPAFIITKRTDATSEWVMLDARRDTHNYVTKYIYANASSSEASSFEILDILSNGFKQRSAWAQNNTSGGTHIYMAFAENPFKYANAR